MENYDYIINAFTKEGDNVNETIDNLTVGCITSKNGNFSLDSDGNLTIKSLNAELSEALKTLVEEAILESDKKKYPVGKIIYGTENPANYLGFGTWEQIKDVFLLACGDTYENGKTGGAATVTLTVNQIPSHTHSISSSGAHTHSIASSGGHNHDAHFLEVRAAQSGADSKNCARINTATYDSSGRVTTTNGAHTHSITSSGAHTHTPANTGGGKDHENMPPYRAVYAWERVE